ncbi:MAG: hypothetical protein HUU54_07490 [Ignavibacteriaceae bacterium]|nr:hypothetical protein [Ignavibacteriaceae bacterium]
MKIALLANSFRDGGRCLAGIELDEKNNPVFVNNRPRWIRPVCKTVHEEVPTELALDVSLLDIIEFEPIEFITSQHQKENVLIENKPFKKAGVFSREHLPALCDNNRQKLLFTNRGKAVKEDQLGAIDYSLSLISAENFHVIEKSYEDKATPQIRGGFKYNNTDYDFPITDPLFLYEHYSGKHMPGETKNLFMTISLSAPFENWAYKLIAAIIH